MAEKPRKKHCKGIKTSVLSMFMCKTNKKQTKKKPSMSTLVEEANQRPRPEALIQDLYHVVFTFKRGLETANVIDWMTTTCLCHILESPRQAGLGPSQKFGVSQNDEQAAATVAERFFTHTCRVNDAGHLASGNDSKQGEGGGGGGGSAG